MLILIAFLPFFTVLIAIFVMFDRLIRLEYHSYRKNWEKDGEPHGFFWVPREARRLGGLIVSPRSSFAMQRCSYVWLFSTPEWIRNDPKAKSILYWLRGLVIFWNVSILVIIVLSLTTFGRD